MFLQSSPHQGINQSTASIMRMVIYCLIPGIAVHAIFFGWGIFIQLGLAIATAIACEATVMELRKKPIEPAIADFSSILTACLLAVSIPSYAPWWVVVIGTVFAIIIVKHLYGGLGQNLFNPAMAAYVMLLISFPVEMTAWMPDQFLASKSFSLTDSLAVISTGFTDEGYNLIQMRETLDGITSATSLDEMKTQLSLGFSTEEVLQVRHLDLYGSQASFWINIAYLIGGIIMWRAKVIHWHIPFAVIVGLFSTATIGAMFAPDTLPGATYHLFSGATMLATFFIATDPVSACTTNKGRIIYGLFIGFITYIIRTWGGYPDAFAFAVLLANMIVPLLDYYTKPTAYGQRGANE